MNPVALEPVEPPPARTWFDVIAFFLNLSKLESRADRQQAEKLTLELERIALDVYRIARGLERKDWTDPQLFEQHRRTAIVERLRSKFATQHVALAHLDALEDRLSRTPQEWYRQGGVLLDCAQELRVHVAVYEYELIHLRQYVDGRAPSVAHDHLAGEQVRWGLSDEVVTYSLVEAGFVRDQAHHIAQFKENVIKRHRLRRLAREQRRRA